MPKAWGTGQSQESSIAWPGWPEDEPTLEEDLSHPNDDLAADAARLRKVERQWRKVQPWLQSQGYMLRPRFRPDWVPSWKPDADEWDILGKAEDAIAHQNVNAAVTMDAFRISDGRHVCLKRVSCRAEDSTEVGILQFLSQPQQRTDPRNHVIPLLDVVRAPDHCFMVFPFYRSLVTHEGLLNTVGEGFDLVYQTLEGLVYLHELRIAHRDFSLGNILMDADRMFPRGFHLDDSNVDRRGHWLSGLRTRTQIGGVRYYLIDFGESIKFGLSDSTLIDLRSKASIHAPETLGEDRPPYDPFKADSYTLGETYRSLFIEDYKGNFNMLLPLIDAMTAADPKNRLTATEALQKFNSIRSSCSRTALHARVWHRSLDPKKGFVGALANGWHWTKQVAFGIQNLKW